MRCAVAAPARTGIVDHALLPFCAFGFSRNCQDGIDVFVQLAAGDFRLILPHRPVSLPPTDAKPSDRITDRLPGQPLAADILRLESIEPQTIEEMYRLFAIGYEDIDETVFRKDLSNKTHVMVLRDSQGELRGFTTAVVWEFLDATRPIRLLFSGDTMVHPSLWGDRTFLTAWLEMAGAAYAHASESPLYWLLLSMSPRTYRTLPLFFRHYYPEASNDEDLERIADSVGTNLFAGRYDASRRLVLSGHLTGRLQADLAQVPQKDRRRADVSFFLARNPSYKNGDEMICLARLNPENIRPSLRRYFLRGTERKELFDQATGRIG